MKAAARASAALLLICLNVYTDTEIDVKQIESEISSAAESRAFFHAVGHLLLIGEMHTKHAERHIEAERVHDEHTHARAEVEGHFGEIGAGVADLAVVRAFEA